MFFNKLFLLATNKIPFSAKEKEEFIFLLYEVERRFIFTYPEFMIWRLTEKLSKMPSIWGSIGSPV